LAESIEAFSRAIELGQGKSSYDQVFDDLLLAMARARLERSEETLANLRSTRDDIAGREDLHPDLLGFLAEAAELLEGAGQDYEQGD
jgi:hypothetical protein